MHWPLSCTLPWSNMTMEIPPFIDDFPIVIPPCSECIAIENGLAQCPLTQKEILSSWQEEAVDKPGLSVFRSPPNGPNLKLDDCKPKDIQIEKSHSVLTTLESSAVQWDILPAHLRRQLGINEQLVFLQHANNTSAVLNDSLQWFSSLTNVGTLRVAVQAN